MMIARCLGTIAFALCALPALCGPQSDPLNSAACKDARSELDAALGQASSGVRLARARARAAAACLGRSDGQAVRSGAPDPPQRISPTVIAEPPRPPALPVAVEPAPAIVVPRPTVITTCDPAGCWDSDGHRLNNMGPTLMGPRGVCTVQGGLANCP